MSRGSRRVTGADWSDNITNYFAALSDIDFAAESLEKELPTLNIPRVLQDLDTNVTIDELHTISEAIQVHLAESSWSLQRPTAQMVKLSAEFDNFSLPIDELLAPRVLVTISTERILLDDGSQKSNAGRTFQHKGHHLSGFKGLVPSDDFNFDHWAERYLLALDAALAKGAHLISFGEFDYPSHIVPEGGLVSPLELAVKNTKFVESIYQKIDSHNRPILLFAGTHHAWRDGQCKNIGLLFHNRPSGPYSGLREPTEHQKTISAKSLGEVLAPFEHPTLPSYSALIGSRTKAGRIGVLICIDVFDATVTNSIFAQSTLSDEDRYGIILVPSYNSSPKLFWSCQSLSYRANCIVVYVNSMHKQKWEDPIANDRSPSIDKEWYGHKSSEIFVSGIPLGTWKDQIETLKSIPKSNPRAMKAMNWPESELPEAMTKLVQLTEGLTTDSQRVLFPGSADSVELRTWKVPNGLFSEVIDFMDRRQPDSTKMVRKHIVTRRNNHLKQKARTPNS